jgi:hypothetical protein
MYRRDYRDIIGGAILLLGGAFVVAYAVTQLQVGSLARMGPGLFPAALGVLLCCFGMALAVPALFRSGTLPAVDLRPLVFVLGSILAFGLTIRKFGIAPAVVMLTLVATLADRRLSPARALLLAAGLAALAVLIFNVGLDIPVAAYTWWGR